MPLNTPAVRLIDTVPSPACGPLSESNVDCNTQPCPPECSIGQWADAGACTATPATTLPSLLRTGTAMQQIPGRYSSLSIE